MKTINIRKIQFNNFSNKVLCFGELCINKLCIDSYVELNFSALNRIVGLLETQLPNFSIYELIQEENNDSEKYYSIDLSGHELMPVSIEALALEGLPSLKISA